MSKRIVWFLFALLTTGSCSVGNAVAAEGVVSAARTATIAGVTAQSYPRVNGSTSTIPIGQMLLCRTLGIAGELRRLPPSPYGRNESSLAFVFPLLTSLTQLDEYSRLWQSRSHRGTHESYTSLTEEQSDLILVAREPSADELKAAQEKKIAFDVRPVALDALVFLVNSANPLSSLSLDQIRNIYTGKVTKWNEAGGSENAIRAYTRDRNSGSEELMSKLVMKDLKMIEGGDRMINSMMGILDAVSRNPHAIAYSIYYYDRVMNPRAENKQLAVNGITPSAATIADRSYPLVEPVYVVTRRSLDAGSPTAKLRDWLLGAEGQELIAASGYVPLRETARP